MTVQLIGTKYAKICEAVWAESSKVPPVIYKVWRHVEDEVFLQHWPGSAIRSRSKWEVCCTSTMICNWLAPSMYKYMNRFRLSRACTQSTTHCRTRSVFVTLTCNCNEVKVKIKDVLHIYNDCAIDSHQECANIWEANYDFPHVLHTNYMKCRPIPELDLTFILKQRSRT